MLRFGGGRLTGASVRQMPAVLDMSAYLSVSQLSLTARADMRLPTLKQLAATLEHLELRGFSIESDAFLAVPRLSQLRLVSSHVKGELRLPQQVETVQLTGGTWSKVWIQSAVRHLSLTNAEMSKWPIVVCQRVDQLVSLKVLDAWLEGGIELVLSSAGQLRELEYGMFPCVLPDCVWERVLAQAFACPSLTRVICGETAHGVCPRLLQVWAACKVHPVGRPFGLDRLRAFMVASDKVEVLVASDM